MLRMQKPAIGQAGGGATGVRPVKHRCARNRNEEKALLPKAKTDAVAEDGDKIKPGFTGFFRNESAWLAIFQIRQVNGTP